ncbi:hypothetical protein CDL12_29606 [Handroanthus impetiginosus]|uniref:Uncharacterized protein n=1 Tax=Handroanthus impetiginosus TaxID=429701 RepID=A0A2G9FXX9_9LAMI|nr:hypothetical protein CDL12_29606 [Handroanthus impetiginosus]
MCNTKGIRGLANMFLPKNTLSQKPVRSCPLNTVTMQKTSCCHMAQCGPYWRKNIPHSGF